MKISVITPAVRAKELLINYESLKKQTFTDFEWIICSPRAVWDEIMPLVRGQSESDRQFPIVWTEDLPLNPGDFMGENKAYNELFKLVKGKLVVTLNDSIWLDPNALEVFWRHYQEDPMSCVAFMGNHYEKVVDGVGKNMTYEDVRQWQVHQDYEETRITNFDACCSSIPAKVVKEIGSIDPMWDKYCCFGIREFMTQVTQKGYTLYISKESGYLGQKHTKLYDKEDLWNRKFDEGDRIYRQRGGAL